MRIVLDTNVLLSAYVFQGYTAEVFDHVWLHHEILLSDWILDEFQEKCRKKFKIPATGVKDNLKHLMSGATILKPIGKPPTVCRDPDDNNVLHLAEFGSAHLILTGDRDLLILESFKKTRITSPRDYKAKEMA